MEQENSLKDIDLLKANLGITINSRDRYLQSILNTVDQELITEKNINPYKVPYVYQMFKVDYAAWRFRSRGEGAMPRNLQYRLHNLLVHSLRKGLQNGD